MSLNSLLSLLPFASYVNLSFTFPGYITSCKRLVHHSRRPLLFRSLPSKSDFHFRHRHIVHKHLFSCRVCIQKPRYILIQVIFISRAYSAPIQDLRYRVVNIVSYFAEIFPPFVIAATLPSTSYVYSTGVPLMSTSLDTNPFLL